VSHAEKSAYYQELKAAGVTFPKTYQEMTTEELKAAVDYLRQETGQPSLDQQQQLAQEFGQAANLNYGTHEVSDVPPAPEFRPAATDTGVLTGTPPRIDEEGLVWYQDEIRKPAIPRPRRRKVVRYVDTGFKEQTVRAGDYVESFEVAGDEYRQAEMKVTMPGYQVGIYKDPRYPFKIHVYNENRGFDLFEVREYWGGAELVPDDVKLIYVANSLCYDMRTVIRAIETEYRQLQLQQANQKG